MYAEEYVSRIQKIDILIANKIVERKRLEELATSTGAFTSTEKVKSSSSPDKMTNAICEYLDIDMEINKLVRERREIISTIEQLPAKEYDVIHELYVQGLTPKEIARKKDKSFNWVFYVKHKALESLQELLKSKEIV